MFQPTLTRFAHRPFQVAGRDGRRVTLSGVEVGASDVYRCELVAEGPPFHTTQRSANMTVVGECQADGDGESGRQGTEDGYESVQKIIIVF